MNTAIFLPNWVGDAVMATPMIRALREQFARPSKLIGVVHPRVLDLFSGNPWFDQLICYDWNGTDIKHRFFAACHKIRREQPDRAIILPHSQHHAALAMLSGAKERIGYNRRQRGFLLTTQLQSPMQDNKFKPCSMVAYYLELARAANCDTISNKMELFTTAEEDTAAENVWQECGWSPTDQVIAINNSGAFGAAKLWPEEHAVELAKRLVGHNQHRVLFLCGPAEKDRAATSAAESGASSLADFQPGLGLTKACLKRCALLITTDSGPRHIAAAFGKPVVTLFGPTDPAWSDTKNQREIQLTTAIECQPCQQRICPLVHHRCMKELTVDMVWAATLTALADSP